MKILRNIIPFQETSYDPNDFILESFDDFQFDEAPPAPSKKSFKASMEDYGKRKAAEKTERVAAAKQWHVDNPVSHHNVLNHYNQATKEEKLSGHSWYEDAHEMTKHIANDTKTSMGTMAGLVSNYSPQTHWASNIMTASKVARTKKGIGGPGSSVMASTNQKDVAERLLKGEHYSNVFKGQKIKAFAHLIEHGNDPHHVVVDRHAYSVAVGKRVPDTEYQYAGLKGKKKYERVSQAFRDAAAHISKTTGETVHPHQVQATTWLVRQRLNQAHDQKMNKDHFGGLGRAAQAAALYQKQWNNYRGVHHPQMGNKLPGTGYSQEVKGQKVGKDWKVNSDDIPF